jgi:hypothetical protein
MMRNNVVLLLLSFLIQTAFSTTTTFLHEEDVVDGDVLVTTNVTPGTSLRRNSESQGQSVNEHEQHSYDDEKISIDHESDIFFRKLKKRMRPHFLQIDESASTQTETQAQTDPLAAVAASTTPKQFFHLHHMKTGGTSLSSLISCASRRHVKLHKHRISSNTNYTNTKTSSNTNSKNLKLTIPNSRLSECSHSSYTKCISGGESGAGCYDTISKATLMTYCAPLAVVDHFHWDHINNDDDHDHDNNKNKNKNDPQDRYKIDNHDDEEYTPGVTMMRDPIDRVWSMYKFQTKSCYKCKSLQEVYDDVEQGKTDQYGTGICIPQLSNHFTRNFLTNLTLDELHNDDTNVLSSTKSSMTDDEKVNNAIHSIRNRFTVVGIIERLDESLDLFSEAFPWLSEDIRNSSHYNDWDFDTMIQEGQGGSGGNVDKIKERDLICKFPHANSSPTNNRCGADGRSHLDLPSHPDEETRKLIEKYNMLDMKVYEAALEHFELQKRALDMDEEEEME